MKLSTLDKTVIIKALLNEERQALEALAIKQDFINFKSYAECCAELRARVFNSLKEEEE